MNSIVKTRERAREEKLLDKVKAVETQTITLRHLIFRMFYKYLIYWSARYTTHAN